MATKQTDSLSLQKLTIDYHASFLSALKAIIDRISSFQEKLNKTGQKMTDFEKFLLSLHMEFIIYIELRN